MDLKLAVFDFDSTLMDGESIGFLAKKMGIEDEVGEITKKAMAGEMDFFEALKKRVALLKGMPVKEAKEALSNLPLINGANKLIAFLKKRGIRCVCFSGGFMWGVESVSKTLGLDAYFANILHHKDDMLSGEVGGYMMFNDSKGVMLKQIQALMGIDEEKTLCVGDGANDISMFQCAKYSVAFCAKDVLKPYASHVLDIKDLSQIIKIIE